MPDIRLGLRANINQFLLLVLVNAFVGAMIGLEQTVVPLLGKEVFGLESNVLILSFIAGFGVVKAILNLFAGNLSDRWNRKKVLVLGWLFAIPVPFLLLYAPNWNWVLFANVLLGVNQGLAWSMTVNMKIDLVGKERRGLALGLNEFAGYISVALVGFLTGYIAAVYGLEPYPLYLGIVFSLLGLVISVAFVRDTSQFTKLEIKEDLEFRKRVDDNRVQDEKVKPTVEKDQSSARVRDTFSESNLNFRDVFLVTSWKNRSLLAASQAGLINNLIFGVTWGIFTIYFVSLGISINETAFLKALHPGIWGFLQLATGPLSDSVGRKRLIYPGMIVQAIGIWVVLGSRTILFGLIIGMVLLGIGTALVYPTLLAAISDIAHPRWRATSIGVYRFWRDLGFVFGAVGIGFIADVSSLSTAIQIVAWISLGSGIFALVFMRETI
ncbi:MAG TPA: MFS transporter, partial [Nitrososphaeraceae archaeon]|nr:MFS transporter [Nitrososphaeraceae archaeon]